MAVANTQTARRRRYLKILAVQKMYLEKKVEGVTEKHVFEKYIEPTFFIGYSTMRQYLSINAKRELTKLEQQ